MSARLRWFARFAVRRNDDARILLNSEREPWPSLVDVTDCCVETRTSAEVWLEVLVEGGERTYVGWIDENGRLHARRSSGHEAQKLVARLVADMGDGTEVEQCALSTGHPNAVMVTGYEVWARIPRRDSLLEMVEGEAAHTYHRFLAAVVRVG